MPQTHQYPSINYSNYHVIKANLPLYDGKPTFRDVIQGNVGSCWFLSAIAAYIRPGADLSSRQDDLKKMIVSVNPTNGIYRVKLGSKWYLVDDYVHAGYFGGGFAGRQKVLWPILLEKAMVSIHSGNCVRVKLDSGGDAYLSMDLKVKLAEMKRGTTGLQYIVGGKVQVRVLHKEDEPGIGSKIGPVEMYKLFMNGEYILANTYKETFQARARPVQRLGAVPTHCYTVFRVDYDKLQGMYYVTIYNPWGRDSIPPEKKPKSKLPLKVDPEHGLFRLSWTEFTRVFVCVHHTLST